MRRIFPALRHTAFARLWFASTISMLGSGITFFALPMLAWDITHSATAFASVFVAAGAGTVLAGIFGGVLADRYDRRRLLITGDTLELCLVIVLAAVAHNHWWTPIPFIAFFIQVSSSTFSSAAPALRRDLLPDENWQSGNALQLLSMQFTNLIAPLAGVLAYQQVGIQPIIAIDVATYVLSILLVSGIRHSATRPVREDSVPTNLSGAARTAVNDVRSALASVRADRVLTMMLAIPLALSVGNGALFAGIMPWIVHDLHAPQSMFGVFMTMTGVTGLGAALLLARTGDRFAPATIMLWSIPGMLLAAALLPIPSVATLLVAGLVVGPFDASMPVAWLTVLQQRVPSNMQGRIGSFFGLTFQLPRLLAMLVFASFVGYFGAQFLMIFWSASVVLATVMQAFLVRDLRSFGRVKLPRIDAAL